MPDPLTRAVRSRPKVTTHQVDDHDAPGGSDLEAQLLRHADPGAPRIKEDHAAGVPLSYQGLRFPARQGHAPAHAEVARREPWTAPQISLEIEHDPSAAHHELVGEHVDPDPSRLAAAAPDQHPQLGYALLNFPVQLNATAPVVPRTVAAQRCSRR
jgi:hypothetical protein